MMERGTRSAAGQKAVDGPPKLRIATWGQHTPPATPSGHSMEEPGTARSQPDAQRTGDSEGIGSHNLRPRSARAGLPAASLLGEEAFELNSDDEEYEGQGSSDEDRRGKKKVGRPIEYKGDPHAPGLTEAESRRIKRRIANRESARRVRTKRQIFLEELQSKIGNVQKQNQELSACCSEIEAHKATLMHQMYLLRDKWTEATQENLKLRNEVAALRQTLEGDLSIIGSERNSNGWAGNRPRRNARAPLVAASSLPTSGSAFELPNLSQMGVTSQVPAATPAPESPVQRSGLQSQAAPGTAAPASAAMLQISPLTGLSSLNPTPSKRLPAVSAGVKSDDEPAMRSQDSLEPLIDAPQMHPAESLFGSLQRAASGALDALSRQPSQV